jgi:hypothetical protein
MLKDSWEFKKVDKQTLWCYNILCTLKILMKKYK